MYNPEYITQDGYIIINENNLKAIGRITEPLYDTMNNKFNPLGSQNPEGKKKRRLSTHSDVGPNSSNSVPKTSGSLINLVDQSRKGKKQIDTASTNSFKMASTD
jgi:hypothetical protein